MFNALGKIDWLGVATSTFAMAVLGALWFTAFFGKAYTYALGREGQPSFKMTQSSWPARLSAVSSPRLPTPY